MLFDLLQQSQQCSFILIENKATNKTNKLIKIKCNKVNSYVTHKDKTNGNGVVKWLNSLNGFDYIFQF